MFNHRNTPTPSTKKESSSIVFHDSMDMILLDITLTIQGNWPEKKNILWLSFLGWHISSLYEQTSCKSYLLGYTIFQYSDVIDRSTTVMLLGLGHQYYRRRIQSSSKYLNNISAVSNFVFLDCDISEFLMYILV